MLKKVISFLYKRYVGNPYLPRVSNPKFKGSIDLWIKNGKPYRLNIYPAWGISRDKKEIKNCGGIQIYFDQEEFDLNISQGEWYDTKYKVKEIKKIEF